MVVLLDTSSSMSDFYREVSAFITGPLLREFLGLEDTFHLISFSDKARLELSRRIEGPGDLEVIIGRMLLLYPLDPYSDISAALTYAEGYVSSLPGGRPKTMLLISDGDQNPPPSAPNSTASGLQNFMAAMQSRLSRRGVHLEFIKVPEGMRSRPRPGPAPVQPVPQPPAPAPQSPAPVPSQARPEQSPQPPQAPVPVLPQAQNPPSPELSLVPPASALQIPILIPEPDPFIRAEPESSLLQEESPLAEEPEEAETESPPFTGEALAPPPLQGRIGDEPALPEAEPALERPLERSPGSSRLIFLNTGFGVLALGIILSLFAGSSRRLQATPNRMLAHGTESPGFEGPPMLSLFVKDQSTTLGRRNLHMLKAGHSLSLGGGKSDFLIVLVPVPPHIARVYFDGNAYFFIPRKPWFFPDIGSQVIQDCLGKTIRIISEKNYEIHIRIERREDPWYALNRMLSSITLPG